MVNAAQYPSPQARRREPRDQMACLFPNRHICDGGPWVNHHPLPSHINVPNPPWLEKARPFPTTTPPSLIHILAPLVAPLVPRLAGSSGCRLALSRLVSGAICVSLMEGFITIWASLMKGVIRASLMEGFVTIWASLMKGVIRASAASSQYRRRREGNRPRSRPACRRPCPSPSSSAAAASRAHTAAAAAAA